MTEKMPAQTPAPSGRFAQAARSLLAVVMHNWPFKLTALFLAVVLWSMLITQDPTLTRERVFNDVTVNVSGMDAMKRNGFIVTSDLSALPGVSLAVDVPQNQYSTVQASIFTPRIDLSRITETGTQEVRVLTNNSATYGTVREVFPSTVELTVEDYITRYRIPVALSTEGEAPAGMYVSAATVDPPMVAVSGPKSLVNSIARAEAMIDLALLPEGSGLVRTAVPFALKTVSGEVIESSLLQVTSESVLLDSVVVEQTLFPTRTLALSEVGLVVGTPARGYEIKQITISPETFVAAGSESALSVVETVFADGEVDVTGLTRSLNRQLRLRRPSDIVHMSPETLTVAVEIGPVITTKKVDDVRVTMTGTNAQHSYNLEVRQADVTIEGELLWLETIKDRDVSLTVDVSGLEAGVYELPIQAVIAGDDEQEYTTAMAPATTKVTIQRK